MGLDWSNNHLVWNVHNRVMWNSQQNCMGPLFKKIISVKKTKSQWVKRTLEAKIYIIFSNFSMLSIKWIIFIKCNQIRWFLTESYQQSPRQKCMLSLNKISHLIYFVQPLFTDSLVDLVDLSRLHSDPHSSNKPSAKTRTFPE